ncbi:MAG TPA: SCO2322 family protein [Acidothermaceae bacterium]|jgi:hypothetical protein
MTLTRAAALGLAALVGYAAVVMTVTGQASAATAYRYWAYYVAAPASVGQASSWQYSQRGPATEHPVNGEVQGWRFAEQIDAANGLLPGAAPNFSALCASTPAKAGDIRVGVVIDFGLASDAPAHEKPPAGVVRGCLNVPDDATGADVLAASAAIRIGTGSDAGLVCGIDGYPKTQCAVAVAASPPPPAATPSPAPSRASPTATASTQQLGPTPDPSPTPSRPPVSTQPVNTPAAISSSVISDASSAAPSSAAPSSAPAQSSGPPPESASPLSLAALRSTTHHNHGIAATTTAGIALIVILGGAAIWRTRARGR